LAEHRSLPGITERLRMLWYKKKGLLKQAFDVPEISRTKV